MTHLSSAEAVRAAEASLSRARAPLPALAGDRGTLRDKLAGKRTQVARLETEWVGAAESDISRHLGHGVRIHDRETWDRPTWTRYLAAAEAHEPLFKPRIRRLLAEIASL
ncbi:MAG: hypothetical protein JO157_11275, partial [Acetobacteraceae bacterium]|nr:hypothetical protein [Acetobacteraceae bacterium]